MPDALFVYKVVAVGPDGLRESVSVRGSHRLGYPVDLPVRPRLGRVFAFALARCAYEWWTVDAGDRPVELWACRFQGELYQPQRVARWPTEKSITAFWTKAGGVPATCAAPWGTVSVRTIQLVRYVDTLYHPLGDYEQTLPDLDRIDEITNPNMVR